MKKSSISQIGFAIALGLLLSFANFAACASDSKSKAENKPPKEIIDARIARDSLPSGADSLRILAPAKHRVIAYYFHGNARCPSCRKIEAYTKEAIDSAFGDALKSGLLEWRVVNTDLTQNEHYLEDYQLYTKSVVISDLYEGKQTRWKNLEKVWELLNDQAKFHAYIQDEIRLFLYPKK